MVIGTVLPPRGPQNWKIDAPLQPYMDGRKPMDAAMVDVLLANLAKQTSLQFKRERRVVQTWVPTTATTTTTTGR